MRRIWCLLALLAGLFLAGSAARAAEAIGEVVGLHTAAAGPGGPLAVGSAIHLDDRIETDAEGVAQILFDDDTKLVVGPNASLVVDDLVYQGKQTFTQLTLSAIIGTFRWISGRSDPRAYRIKTPLGDLTVRGTAFDFNVDEAGRVDVVVYDGRVEFCSTAGVCRRIERPCDILHARTREDVRWPVRFRRADAADGRLPFLGNEGLLRAFRTESGGCLVRKKAVRQARLSPRRTTRLAHLPAKPARARRAKPATRAKAATRQVAEIGSRSTSRGFASAGGGRRSGSKGGTGGSGGGGQSPGAAPPGAAGDDDHDGEDGHGGKRGPSGHGKSGKGGGGSSGKGGGGSSGKGGGGSSGGSD